MTNECVNSQRFRRREWWLLIAVLLMIEYWIFSISHELAGEQTVVNYVSFAAAIASILLAIVAIIYSFVQSESQQRSGNAIASQVEQLQKASANLTHSKEQLEAQLDRVGSVTTKIDALQDMLGGKISSLQDGVEMLRSDLKLKSAQLEPTKAANFGDEKALAEAILARSTFEADLLAFALFQFKEKGDPKKKYIHMLSEHFAKPLSEIDSRTGYTAYLLTGVQIISVLRAVGLIATEDNTIKMTPKLEEFLAEYQGRVAASKAETLTKGVSLILKSFSEPV
jgi:hypothetical protein